MSVPKTPKTSSSSIIQTFLNSNASGGIILMFATAIAMVIANSGLQQIYYQLLETYVAGLSILHWINDGLMVVFFLLVGLEIKREVLDGQLSDWPSRVLPGSAAIGGMIFPALVYLFFNRGSDGYMNGWAIPTATDIAFALGILSLLGSRVPIALRIFLTALAIIDDLCAVIIIALFYTNTINIIALLGAIVITTLLIALNRFGIKRLLPYAVLGVLLWFVVLQSGVHATLAGVILALTIPFHSKSTTDDNTDSLLLKTEHALHPWVTFLIIPIFGFANAGISLTHLSITTLTHPVSIGITLGLLFGKQCGIFLASFTVIKLGWATLPDNVTWRQIYGVSILCGIGFTMSLFIGLLAFPQAPELQYSLKVGVLLGSIVSAIAGVLVLRKNNSHL